MHTWSLVIVQIWSQLIIPMSNTLADEFLAHYSNESEWAEPNLAIARRHQLTNKVNCNAQQFSLHCHIAEFQKYGPGIYLFFRFSKIFSFGLLLLTVVSLPLLITNCLGGGLNQYGGGWNKMLMRTTLANQRYYQWSRLARDPLLQSRLNVARSIIVWNDVVCSMVFAGLLLYWKVSAAAVSRESVMHRILPSSYTVVVHKLPLAFTEESLKQHLSKFGEVVEISPVKNISELKKHADKIDSLVSQILTITKDREDCSWERLQLEMHLNLFLGHCKSYRYQTVTSSILSFNLPRFRNYVSDIYKYRIGSSQVLDYQSAEIKVHKLKIQPVNIVWQNFHIKKETQFRKSVLLGGVMLLIMLVGLVSLFLIRVNSFVQLPLVDDRLYTYEDAVSLNSPVVTNTFCSNVSYKNFQPQYLNLCKDFLSKYSIKLLMSVEYSLVLIGLNWILSLIIKVLVRFRKYPTVSQKSRFTILCLSVFMFFTNCVLTLLVQGEVGSVSIRSLIERVFTVSSIKQVIVYKEFSRKWFLDIGSQIIVNNIITLILGPPFAIVTSKIMQHVRLFKAKRTKFQRQMNEVLLDPLLDINYYYVQLLTTIFFCMMYSSAMPILYFFGAVSLTVIHTSSKYVFLRFCREPNLIDHSLDTLISRLIPLSLGLHQVMSFTFYSVEEFFPNPLVSTSRIDRLLLSLRQGFVFVLGFIIIGVYILFQKEIDKFIIQKFSDKTRQEQVSLNNILKLESKYLYSYKIQDNPAYVNLFKMLKIVEQVEKHSSLACPPALLGDHVETEAPPETQDWQPYSERTLTD